MLAERVPTDLAEPSVSAIADRLGVSASFVSQTFSKLHEKGWVERRTRATPRGRVVEYEPLEGLDLQWVAPEERVAIRWSCRGAVDWEFPLASQIPDEKAREIVATFLRELRDARLLDGERARSHAGLGVVAYGSAARGDSRPGSDIDLLVLEAAKIGEIRGGTAAGRSARDPIADIAADLSLRSPRPLQVQVVDASDAPSVPPWIVDAIQREGMVVHDGARGRWSKSGFGLFRWVYGDRPHEASG